MRTPSLKYLQERGRSPAERGSEGRAGLSTRPQSAGPGRPALRGRGPEFMKRLFALVAAALVAVALYAATAQSGQEAVTPAQFRALSAKVTKIRADLNATISVLANCVMGTAIPISQYSRYLAVDQNN